MKDKGGKDVDSLAFTLDVVALIGVAHDEQNASAISFL